MVHTDSGHSGETGTGHQVPATQDDGSVRRHPNSSYKYQQETISPGSSGSGIERKKDPVGRTQCIDTAIVQRTMTDEAFVETAQCVCGKTCNNAKGLMIHQSRMGCQPDREQRRKRIQCGPKSVDSIYLIDLVFHCLQFS